MISYVVSLYSMEKSEIENFLKKFLETNISLDKNEWELKYQNPIEMTDIIGVYVDNREKFKINMWICIDDGFWINVTDSNANNIIKYLYERFPY